MTTDEPEFIWLDERHEISIHELVKSSKLSLEEICLLVEAGALIPNNPDENIWHFSSYCVISIRTLSRLKRDFELEPNALALTFIFLERIRMLESQLRSLDTIKTYE